MSELDQQASSRSVSWRPCPPRTTRTSNEFRICSIVSSLVSTAAPVCVLIGAAAPTLCITINPAFVCSTYLWRQGDKAHRLKTFEVAAAWYLLAAHPVLRSLEEKIWQKCFR